MAEIIRIPNLKENSYLKIKASFHMAKDRLYRTVLVKEHSNLFELACCLCAAFGAEFEHLFAIESGNVRFVPDFMVGESFDRTPMLPIDKHTTDDLKETFSLEYDFGDGWRFDCKIYKKTTVLQEQRPVILLEGKGQGIWEDNIGTLYAYLAGQVDPEYGGTDENLGIYPPWNFKIKKYKDFDAPLDIEKIQKKLDKTVPGIISELRESMYAQCAANGYSDDDDDGDEIDFEDMMQSVTAFLISTVDNQTQTVPYVKETFLRLRKKYDEDDALDKITNAFMKEFEAMLYQNAPYGPEVYKKRLEKLK